MRITALSSMIAVKRFAGLQHLAAPGGGGAPKVVVAERLSVGRGSGDAILVDIGRKLLGRMEASPRHLHRQFADRIPRQPRAEAVELRRFDVVAILVRLAAAERRRFDLPVVDDQPGRHHAEGDVRASRASGA